MIDHTGISVGNYAASKQFYSSALAAIGYALLAELPQEITGGRNVEAVCHTPA